MQEDTTEASMAILRSLVLEIDQRTAKVFTELQKKVVQQLQELESDIMNNHLKSDSPPTQVPQTVWQRRLSVLDRKGFEQLPCSL